MRFSVLERFPKTLAFRLTFWYSAIFILSFLLLSIISYLFVFSLIRDQRQDIIAAVSEYSALFESGGLQAIDKAVHGAARASRRNSFFVRIINVDDQTLFLSNPRLWQQFELLPPVVENRWRYYTSRRDGDLLEVTTRRLRDGTLIEVGKSLEDRTEVLERFRDTLLATIIPMVVIGFGGGAFLAFRALRPIRDLSAAAKAIVDTARFDTRVPETQTAEELTDLIWLFNEMLTKIESLIRGMTESLDNVAHDLRTPVTRLRGVAEEALRSERGAEECREALADCLEEAERLMSMLNTLMDISEAETGTMRLSYEDVNLSAMVGEVAELYHDVAEDKRIQIATQVPKMLLSRGDRSRIRQVLANLVDNAVKYTPAGGCVTIEACEDDEDSVVRVRDTGIGITPLEIPQVWNRLYRGDQSRSQRGLGLGLSLVKAVVRAHHGRVEVASEPGRGSVFSIFLPRSPAR